MRVVYQDDSIKLYEDHYVNTVDHLRISRSSTPQWYIGYDETILFLRGETTSADHTLDKISFSEIERAIETVNKINQDIKLML